MERHLYIIEYIEVAELITSKNR